MIDFIDTIVTAAAAAVMLVVISTLPQKWSSRLAMAAALGAWFGLAIAIVASGKLSTPLLGLLVALPLVVSAVLAVFFPAARSAMLAIPFQVIIGVNIFRVLAVMFLVLASVGRLAGPFPLLAGWGDILTGVFAIPLVALAARVPANDSRILAWNVLGTLDLVIALSLGVLSAPGSPLQLIHAGVGSAAILTLPWSLVPTILVPLYLVGHGIVFAQARAASVTRPSNSAFRTPAAT